MKTSTKDASLSQGGRGWNHPFILHTYFMLNKIKYRPRYPSTDFGFLVQLSHLFKQESEVSILLSIQAERYVLITKMTS